VNRSLIILHDYFETAEGGGRLCLALGRAVGADLAYGFRAGGHPYFREPYDAGREFSLDARSRVRVWKQARLVRAFTRKTGFVRGYRTALYSGFYAVCAANRHPAARNVYYCHTPPRFLYDQQALFLEQAGVLGRPVLQGFDRWYRPQYEAAVARMDCVLTNSRNVRERVRAHLGVDARVVHPPCDTARFRFLGQAGYYLSCARLDPLKNVDRIVRAFMKMPDRNLVVVSGGPEGGRIRRLARDAPNVRLLGRVDEALLRRLIGNCIATVYIPRQEDFGMSPVESMAAGKPVLGVREGGLVETVVHGETGLLLPGDPSVDDVVGGVRDLHEARALSMRRACTERARRFDTRAFLERMKEVLRSPEGPPARGEGEG